MGGGGLSCGYGPRAGEGVWGIQVGILEQRNGQGARSTPSFTHLFFQLFSQHEYNTQWGAKGRPEAHGTHRMGWSGLEQGGGRDGGCMGGASKQVAEQTTALREGAARRPW